MFFPFCFIPSSVFIHNPGTDQVSGIHTDGVGNENDLIDLTHSLLKTCRLMKYTLFPLLHQNSLHVLLLMLISVGKHIFCIVLFFNNTIQVLCGIDMHIIFSIKMPFSSCGVVYYITLFTESFDEMSKIGHTPFFICSKEYLIFIWQ